MKINKILFGLLLLSFTSVFVACDDDEDLSQYNQENLEDLTVRSYLERASNNVAGNAKYTTLYAALEKANLLGAVEGEVTLFAPTNAAFDAAGIVVEDVPADQLASILTYHVVSGQVLAESLGGATTTANGATFNVAGTCINGTTSIATTDITVGNGVIHELGGVLMPPTGTILDKVGEFTSAATPEFTVLEAAVVKAGLAGELDGSTRYTIFAPTDAAFASAGITIDLINNVLTAEEVGDVLSFHALSGEVFSCAITPGLTATLAGPLDQIQGVTISTEEGVSVNGASVVTADVLASNGVIHVVDAVIEPVNTIQQELSSSSAITTEVVGIFDEILDKSGVTYALDDNVILYIPSNYAMQVNGVDPTALTPEQCEEIVMRHTFSVTSAELVPGTYVENMLGEAYLFSSYPNGSFAGDFLNLQGLAGLGTIATDGVIVADLTALGGALAYYGIGYADESLYNGVIVSLNDVLTAPPTATIVDELVADGNYTALVAAAVKTGLATTLAEDNYTVFAPTDAAFAAIGLDAAAIDALDPEVEADAELIAVLEATLLKHVSTSIAPGASLLEAGSIDTAAETTIGLELDSGDNVVITDNTLEEGDNTVVIGTDVLVSNGIIHTIDKVLQ